MKKGGQPFAPTLQVSVEAEAVGIDPLQVLDSMKECLDTDTEDLVTQALTQRNSTKCSPWPTPIAKQGDTLEVYFRRSIKRMKQGHAPFVAHLSTAVSLDKSPFEVLDALKDKLDRPLEELVTLAMTKSTMNSEDEPNEP